MNEIKHCHWPISINYMLLINAIDYSAIVSGQSVYFCILLFSWVSTDRLNMTSADSHLEKLYGHYKKINSNITCRSPARLPTCPHVSIPHTIFHNLPGRLKRTERANRVEMCWLVLVKVWCMALSESTAIWKSLQLSLLFSNQSELYILKENVQPFNIWI